MRSGNGSAASRRQGLPCWSRRTTSSSRLASPTGSCCSAPGELLADGDPAEVLAGGWHFATEVARILDGAAVTPDAGLALLSGLGVATAETPADPGAET